IAGSGGQALNYFVAQEYTKAIGKFATSPNAKTILFPVEATQLIGSIGGIGELVKSITDDRSGGSTPPRAPAPSPAPRPQPRSAAPSVPRSSSTGDR
ncbi:MAG: SPFH/Band 7/PHB domain protein, partial [Qipengyuania vulgaris]